MSTKRTTERGYLTGPDGQSLYYEQDVPTGARGAVLLVHGFAEHCGRYGAVAERLCEAGLAVYRFDLRGHGRSGGRRGHVHAFDEYLRDLHAFRGRVFEAHPDRPRFLAGHSNGGLVAFHSAANAPGGWAGLVLSSPFFGFALRVPAWKALLGKGLSGLVPTLALPTGMAPELVCRDAEVVAAYAADPLVGDRATARWFTETLAAHAAVDGLAPRLRLPTLVQQAGDDRIASADAARRVFDQIGAPDKLWRAYPSLYHEIWFDRAAPEPLADLLAWLSPRLPEA